MLWNDLAETLSLDGPWAFSLGEKAAWGEIQVPGCWEAQGYSKFIEGPAFYRREVTIPSHWDGQAILAEFDAVSYACTVRLNGVEVGAHRGLWTPFAVDLTSAARPGETNLLELTVYKPGERYPMRSSLAGFIPDVATTFGGIWQSARLRALRVGLGELQVDTDGDNHRLHLRCRSSRATKEAQRLAERQRGSRREWGIEVSEVCSGGCSRTVRQVIATEDGRLDEWVTVPHPRMWTPAHPNLYSVRVTFIEEDKAVAQATQRVGFRRLSTDGNQLLLNGQPFMARGILSWGWQPDHIAPTYTREQARAEIQRVRSLGFNLVKLCLFIPNQTYFDVADEEGMLLWQEWPMWLPEVTPDLRALAPREYADFTRLTRCHPSVALYSLGCELSRGVDGELLGQLNDAVRTLVSDVLICDNSGSGESYGGLDFDYADFSDYHPYYDLHYFEPLLDNWRRDWQLPRPWIFGEFCDSDTFRDLDEIIAANGGSRPWWLTRDNPVTTWRSEPQAVLEWHERMRRADLNFTSKQLTEISYAQSQVTRKYTLEALRRRAGMGGYVITGLRDTPISTSGIWDDFERPKWTAEEFRRSNDEVVLCLDIGRRRKWRHGGDRPERLDVHNFWSGEMAHWRVILHTSSAEFPAGSQLCWKLSDLQGHLVSSGSQPILQTILPGLPREIGVISCLLPVMVRPVELRLEVSLLPSSTAAPPSSLPSNQWPVWVFPNLPDPPANLGIVDPTQELNDYGEWLNSVRRVHPPEDLSSFGVILATVWDAGLEDYVRGGGRVLLLQQGNGPFPARRCPFWREAIKLFSAHPLWDRFPQRGYTDLQFFGIASDVAFDTMRLREALPELASVRPILRRLDAREFHLCDYLLEARVGKGTLVACSLRLQGGTGNQPFGWQRNVAGGAMLWGLLEYLSTMHQS